MTAIKTIAEQKVILPNVSWETYERLLAENVNPSSIRFTYDEGSLEIMVLSLKHENPNRTLATLVEVLAEELNIDIARAGSTTFKQQSSLKGFEPDSCFYIKNADAVSGKKELDLNVDPPPDLLIEIDISSPSLPRFPIFAAAGAPEVWRYADEEITIFSLVEGQYIDVKHSLAFPIVTDEILTQLLHESLTLKSTAWLRRVREWIRANR